MSTHPWAKRIFLLLIAYLIYLWTWNHSIYAASDSQIQPLPSPPSLEGKEVPLTEFEAQLQQAIHFNPDGENLVGHILIDDKTLGINESTWLYLKKALEHYKTVRPIFVILELNTPGGEVYAAQKISDALKELDIQAEIPVIAYINNWAISAGAMLAYSCRFIVSAKDGSMGAAEPLVQDSSGKTEVASEKVNSALRADFASRALFFNRNPYIAEAMVDKDIILVQRHGKVIKLDNDSQIQRTGANPDILISPKGKLLTLTAEQLKEYGVADLVIPPTKTGIISPAELDAGKWPASKTSLFQQPFFKDIPHASIDSYRMDWKTKFFFILASPVVSSILFLGLIVGLYLEINNPGFGIPATIALTCLFLIVLSSFSLEIGNWLELILLLAGVAILLVELFILPGFGLFGFIGILFFFAGLFGLMLPGLGAIDFEFDTQTFNAAGEAFFRRLAWLSGAFVIAAILIFFISRYVTPHFPGFKRFVLSGNEQDADRGYVAGEDPAKLAQPGEEGTALSAMRPSGKVMIKDTIYDAISNGSFIEQGKPVIVVRLEGSVIVVNQKEEGASS